MNTFPLNQAYERASFLKFLRSFLDDFSQDIEPLYMPTKSQYAQDCFRLGHDKSLDLEVYEIHHTSTNDARVGIAKEAFKLLFSESLSNRALVVFVPESSKQWRLSLLQIEAEVNEKGRVEKTYSNPRRHSYLLGEGGSLTTPQKFLFEMGPIQARKDGNKQLSAVEDLQSRFSVEALTKEFYNKLYNWYLWAVEPSTGVTFPNLVNTSKDDRDDIAIKIIRLITRLLFVWFIKQKKLVPAEIFDETELNKILANFDPQSEKDGKYYNAILQNLFFATLNNEIDKRRFMSEPFQGKSTSFGVKTLFRDSNKASWFKIQPEEVIELFRKVPFMNCGLFECLDKYAKSDLGVENDLFLDGFSSRDSKQDGHYKYRAFIPNRLFFAEEHMENVTVEDKGQKKTDTISVMGLINLLKLYNFTVQENTPSEVEVSLDPELLGQVFENLLAAYNPETQESARKSTGSFYTPRPIVEYMVNESLIAYLKTKVPSVEEDTWRALISYEDKHFELTEDQRTATLNALYECKILDPACGSGAFPMGMLQQMVHITRKLDSEFDPYQTKLRIINNCIYGSDIQPIAMLISKLRFFISLICEQDESRINYSDPDNNYGIDTLPNLETKFVAANSLLRADIRNYADDDWTQDATLIKLKNDLLAIRKSHFSVRTQTTKLKKREEDRLKREEIQNYILQSTTQPDPVKIQMYEARINHLNAERDLYEGEKIVEEIVDTQASLFDEAQPQVVRKDINKIHRDRIDAEIKGLQQAIAKEQNKRNPVGFNAAIKQITDWNPYDQLKAAPFFDPDWMFGITDGFDIVFGNPPYISAQAQVASTKLATQRKQILESGYYRTLHQKWDLYVPFMELAIRHLCTEGGVMTMIVPYPLTNQIYAEKLRKMFVGDYCMYQIVDLSGTKVFENATVSNCIPFVRKSAPIDHVEIAKINEQRNIYINFDQPITQLLQDEQSQVWNLTQEKRETNRHADLHTLGDFCYISKGMVLNADEVTAKGDFKKEDLISCTKDRIHCRKYIEGKDVEPYSILRVRYLEYNTDRVPDKLSRPTFRELYEREKILFNCLGSLKSMIDIDSHYLHNDSIICGMLWNKLSGVENRSIEGVINKFSKLTREELEDLSKHIDLKYLLGVLNSKYANKLLRDLRGGGLRIYPDHIRKLPIPLAKESKQKQIVSIVDEILNKKSGYNQADTLGLEGQIDILVYLLYGLTYDELRNIDPEIETIISETEYNKRLAENA